MRSKKIIRVIILAALAVFLVGCDSDESNHRDLKFNLKAHVEDRHMDCVDCHPGVETEDDPGWPDMETVCLGCHRKKDKDLQGKGSPYSEKCLYCHSPRTDQPLSEQKVVLGFGKSEDLEMPHGKHFQADIECADCHGEIAGVESFLSCGEIRPTAEDCLSCHEKKGESTDCATCHKTRDLTMTPDNHKINWIGRHGVESMLTRKDEHGKNCSTCHTGTECMDCHTQEEPRSHTNFWRQRGHGLEAGIDREKCLVCHRQDSCVRCHTETAPRSHKGAWKADHCGACHLQSSFTPENNTCAVCHRQIPHVIP